MEKPKVSHNIAKDPAYTKSKVYSDTEGTGSGVDKYKGKNPNDTLEGGPKAAGKNMKRKNPVFE